MMIDVQQDGKSFTALEISLSPWISDRHDLAMTCVRALKDASVSTGKTVHVTSEDLLVVDTLTAESFCPTEGGGYYWPRSPGDSDIVLLSGAVYQVMGDVMCSFSDPGTTLPKENGQMVQPLCSIRKSSEGEKGDGVFMDLAVDPYTVIAVEPMIRGEPVLPPPPDEITSENGESSLSSVLACKINSGEEKVNVMGITTNLEHVLQYYMMNPLERKDVDLHFFGVDPDEGLKNPVVVRVIVSVCSLEKDEELLIRMSV